MDQQRPDPWRGQPPPGDRGTGRIVVAGVLLVVVAVLAVLVAQKALARMNDTASSPTSDDQVEAGTSDTQAVAADGTDGSGGEAGDPAAEGDGDGTASPATSVVDTPPPDGAYLDARLDLNASPGRGLFALTGRLPEGPEADALLTRIQAVYSPFAEVDVVRDASLEGGPWLDAATRIVPLLGSLSTSSTRISPDGVIVEGESSAPEIEVFSGGVQLLAGELPVDVSGLRAVDLREPSYYSVVEDGVMTVGGEVPTQAFADAILAAAVSTYGPDGVVDELVVTPEVHPAFWMHSVPNGIRQLAGYPSYRFVIADGTVEADLQGDAGFEPDSAELNESSTVVVGLWFGVMSQDPTSILTIRGHTDSDGSDDYNQQLSQARAEAYRDALIGLGVSPDRLVAEGAGESEPVALNDTPENKAKNRRVEFVFE